MNNTGVNVSVVKPIALCGLDVILKQLCSWEEIQVHVSAVESFLSTGTVEWSLLHYVQM